jgi:hypothetical protein
MKTVRSRDISKGIQRGRMSNNLLGEKFPNVQEEELTGDIHKKSFNQTGICRTEKPQLTYMVCFSHGTFLPSPMAAEKSSTSSNF